MYYYCDKALPVYPFHSYNLEATGREVWQISAVKVQEEAGGKITETDEALMFTCKFVAIATGHHTIPVVPKFLGQDRFKGSLNNCFNHTCLENTNKQSCRRSVSQRGFQRCSVQRSDREEGARRWHRKQCCRRSLQLRCCWQVCCILPSCNITSRVLFLFQQVAGVYQLAVWRVGDSQLRVRESHRPLRVSPLPLAALEIIDVYF